MPLTPGKDPLKMTNVLVLYWCICLKHLIQSHIPYCWQNWNVIDFLMMLVCLWQVLCLKGNWVLTSKIVKVLGIPLQEEFCRSLFKLTTVYCFLKRFVWFCRTRKPFQLCWWQHPEREQHQCWTGDWATKDTQKKWIADNYMYIQRNFRLYFWSIKEV